MAGLNGASVGSQGVGQFGVMHLALQGLVAGYENLGRAVASDTVRDGAVVTDTVQLAAVTDTGGRAVLEEEAIDG